MSRKHLLVIDDDPVVAEMLRLYFMRIGYAVDITLNGSEAMLLIEEGRHFDCIVLDILMPRMDGNEFLAALAVRNDLTPIIVLTGYPKLLEEVHESRVGFMPKPPNCPKLAGMIAQVIEKSKLEDIQ